MSFLFYIDMLFARSLQSIYIITHHNWTPFLAYSYEVNKNIWTISPKVPDVKLAISCDS